MSSAASSASSAASPPSSRPLTSKQAARTYRQLCDFGWDMDKYVFLDQLHDRNETLYYRVLTGHLAEPLPVVYDPTVGEAIKLWSREYRRSRAVYLSVDRIEDVRPSLEGLGLGPDDVDLLVVSDAEEILGNRHARVRGQRYDALVEEYLSAAAELFPRALLHFEDFGPSNARRILQANREKYGIFNDLQRRHAGHRYGRPDPRRYGPRRAEPRRGALPHLAHRPGGPGHRRHGGPARLPAGLRAAGLRGVERPIVLPLSNPTERIEAMPADVIAWSKGRALVATGIPISPFDYDGTRFIIGQGNNSLLYPGLGLGVIVSGASRVTDGMLLAAARAVADQADPTAPGAALLPPVENLRASSATVAVAVARQAQADGVATADYDNLIQAVQDAMWEPAYPEVDEA